MQKRILGQVDFTGNLLTLSSLVASGQYDVAKSLLPAPQTLYPGVEENEAYTRGLEDHLKPFLAMLDPEQALRFEAQILRLKPATGPFAPQEANADRAMRLVKLYRQHRPWDRIVQTELLARITSGNQLAALAIRDEVAAWAKGCDHKATLEVWAAGSGKIVGRMAHAYFASLEYQVLQSAALNSFLQGDTRMLEQLTADLVAAPVLVKTDDGYPYRGHTQFVVRSCQQELTDRAAYWIWLAISRDETSGFEKSLKSFEELALNTNKRFEFDPAEVASSLAICHFLANWIGQPERFDALCAKMTNRQPAVQNFPRRDGIVPLARAAARSGAWKSGYSSEIRAKALLRLFAQPSLAPLVSRDGGWLDRLGEIFPQEEIDAIAALPSETFIPEVSPGLAEYLGKRKTRAKQPDEAIAAFKKSIAACPATPDWNDLRSAAIVQLAEVLISQNRQDEARGLIAAMPASQIGDWIRARYRKIAASLGVTEAAAPETK